MLKSAPAERTDWCIYVHLNLQEQVTGPLTTISMLYSQQEKANTVSPEMSSSPRRISLFALQVCSIAIVWGGWEEKKTQARDERERPHSLAYDVWKHVLG